MAVTQADTLAAMQVLLAAGVPVLLRGDPGTGKTSMIERYARRAGWHLEAVIASIHDPTDFSGLPVRSGDTVRYVPPAWAARVAEHQGWSLVFFDEINTAAPATQNALMRVVQQHHVGYLDLGERVRFIAAANPAEQNSGAWDLSAPLANRFAHLDWPLSVSEWQTGHTGGWPDPEPLDIDHDTVCKQALADHKNAHAAFVAARPKLLCDIPDAQVSPRAWPSPRSWERLAACEAIADTVDAPDTVRELIIAALIGDAAAVEYRCYRANPDLPDPAELLDAPQRFGEIERTDQQLAALEAIETVAAEQPERWRDAFKVCVAAADAGAADVAVATARRLIKTKPPKARLPKGHETFIPILAQLDTLTNNTTP